MGNTDEAKAKNEVSQLEDTGAVAIDTTPDHAEEKLTFRDFWEHRRVLGFCKSRGDVLDFGLRSESNRNSPARFHHLSPPHQLRL